MTAPSSVPGSAVREPAAYDFRRPMTLAREHARMLEMAFETFTRHWANQLVARLRTSVQAELGSVQMTSYEEYIASLPATTTMVVCSVEPGRRPAVIQFPVDTALVWIDHMLGGPGTPGAVPERDLTEIEQQLVRVLITHILGDLNYSFAGVLALDAEYRHIQYGPQFVQAAAASTPVISARLSLQIQEHTVPVSVMLPAEGLITALREVQGTDTRSVEEIEAERTQRDLLDLAVQQVPVEVALRLRPVPVHPRDIGELAVGDLLPLHHPSSQPLDVVVGDRVIAQAAAGSNGSRLAGLVVHVKESS